MSVAPEPSLSGVPLQKFCASVSSATPRAMYSSPMFADCAGRKIFIAAMAWFAEVRTWLMLRYWPWIELLSGGLLNDRSSASSFWMKSEEHTSELQSRLHLVFRLLF